METIKTASYQVHFNTQAIPALRAYLGSTGYSMLFILVDENTRRDCLQPFLELFNGFPEHELLQIASGEENKNITTCIQLWEELSEKGADRKSLLINLGGGVLTDLGGFVASTFKRGIAFINIPTTLLAMVDASIGGKTGVDLGPLKNQVGVINQPEMVLIFDDFLKTLEQRQLQSGFAEMLKHGLIRNRSYWQELKSLPSLEQITPYIFDSVNIKNEVVLQDPREEHLRKILNFGHTLGHAIESYFLSEDSRMPLLHGEAIAIGMILEAYLSHKLCGLDIRSVDEIRETFRRWYPEVPISEGETKQILDLLIFDKKNTHGRINFVLLSEIGEPVIDVTVPADLFEEAFAYYRE
jgi:3-dehydroquinate synthase